MIFAALGQKPRRSLDMWAFLVLHYIHIDINQIF